jgi:hypothetical protein
MERRPLSAACRNDERKGLPFRTVSLAHGPEESLRKLQLETKDGYYKCSLWEHHSDKFLLTSESMFMQKVNYIHNNSVKEDLVERRKITNIQVLDFGSASPFWTMSLSKWTSSRSGCTK